MTSKSSSVFNISYSSPIKSSCIKKERSETTTNGKLTSIRHLI